MAVLRGSPQPNALRFTAANLHRQAGGLFLFARGLGRAVFASQVTNQRAPAMDHFEALVYSYDPHATALRQHRQALLLPRKAPVAAAPAKAPKGSKPTCFHGPLRTKLPHDGSAEQHFAHGTNGHVYLREIISLMS
jgi:hypothetical protein